MYVVGKYTAFVNAESSFVLCSAVKQQTGRFIFIGQNYLFIESRTAFNAFAFEIFRFIFSSSHCFGEYRFLPQNISMPHFGTLPI